MSDPRRKLEEYYSPAGPSDPFVTAHGDDRRSVDALHDVFAMGLS